MKKTSKHWTANEINIILLHAHKTCPPGKYNTMYGQPFLADMPGLIYALKDIRSEASINKCWRLICRCNFYKNNMHLTSRNMSDSLFTAIKEGFKLFHNPPPKKEEVTMPVPKKQIYKPWTVDEIYVILQHAHKYHNKLISLSMFRQGLTNVDQLKFKLFSFGDGRTQENILRCWDKICNIAGVPKSVPVEPGAKRVIPITIGTNLRRTIKQALRLFYNKRDEENRKIREATLRKKTLPEDIRFLIVSEAMGEEEYEVYDNLSQVEEVLLDEAMDRVKAKDKSPLPKVYRCTEMEVDVNMKVNIK